MFLELTAFIGAPAYLLGFIIFAIFMKVHQHTRVIKIILLSIPWFLIVIIFHIIIWLIFEKLSVQFPEHIFMLFGLLNIHAMLAAMAVNFIIFISIFSKHRRTA